MWLLGHIFVFVFFDFLEFGFGRELDAAADEGDDAPAFCVVTDGVGFGGGFNFGEGVAEGVVHDVGHVPVGFVIEVLLVDDGGDDGEVCEVGEVGVGEDVMRECVVVLGGEVGESLCGGGGGLLGFIGEAADGGELDGLALQFVVEFIG